MKKDDPLSKYENITSDMIKKEPVIVSKQTGVKNELAGWIGGNRRKLNIKTTYNLVSNAFLLCKEGGGYVITFKDIIPLSDESELVYKDLSPSLKVGMHIAWKKYHVFSKQAEMFLDLLRSEMEKE